ncbi:ankyrin repeat domain-containing protein [Aspergillus mulundensis]|uniref:Uncharacterized protein n=1 Tax=Aspergillus mulundensis TaxID=1810919 RepID=A0A3D8T7V6_9EURO|nr:hypothetical protein DSM5745_01400 [Aspergillus mulundensis]RDW94078.1 hypothetical protein DSM5745_01400 [Aspergillus mulundensis]
MHLRNDEAALLLLRRGADPASIHLETLRALVNDLPRTFIKLLEMGMYKDEHVYGYNAALHLAASHGAEELMKILLQRTDIDVDHVLVSNSTEGSPLCVAALRGHVKVVQLLLYQGATVDIRDGAKGDGQTPLMLNLGSILWYRNERIIKALVDAGADVSARDELGQTPLMYLCGYEYAESI